MMSKGLTSVKLETLPKGESSLGDGEPDSSASSARFAFDDAGDMRRMGKQQAFQRNFEYLSIAAFSVVAIAGYCYVPSTSGLVLANGGTGGMIVIFLINWFGLGFVVLSLAEMSSTAPTAGGQYHWVSEFAPPSIQKYVSYLSGWLSSIAWLAGTASGMNLSGSTLQGLIVVNRDHYSPKPYQGYLFVVMVATFGLSINTFFARLLPRLEAVIFLLFTLAFVGTMVAFWGFSSRLTAAEVFGTFTNSDGYSSLGLSLLSVQSPIMFLIVGSDATAHMAEETRNSSRTVPKAMITSFMVNAGLALFMTVSFCFVLTQYDAATASPVGVFGYPFIQVFVDALGSYAGGTALVAVLTILQVLGIVNWMASTARQVFAFARDQGFPASGWVSRVNAAGTHPRNALLCVWTFVVLINLINLGSVVAFEAIVSLQILALMSTYLVSLGCIIWRRLRGAPLPASPWTLGRFALPINVVGFCYSLYLIVFLPWPAHVPVTASSFNWSSVMFAGIMAIAGAYYAVHGRKVYKGPAFYVRPRGE